MPDAGEVRWQEALALTAVLVIANNVAIKLGAEGLATLGVNFVLVGLTLLYSTRRGMSLGDLGLRSANFWRSAKWGGVVAAGFGGVAVIALLVGKTWFPDQVRQQAEKAPANVGALLLELASILVVTAFCEETLFRGVQLTAWDRALQDRDLAWARDSLIITSIAFGLWHFVTAFDDFLPPFGTLLMTTVGGLLFGCLRRRTKNLAAPVIAHFAFNASFVVVGYFAR